jgi:hypothetical protein
MAATGDDDNVPTWRLGFDGDKLLIDTKLDALDDFWRGLDGGE